MIDVVLSGLDFYLTFGVIFMLGVGYGLGWSSAIRLSDLLKRKEEVIKSLIEFEQKKLKVVE